MTPRSATNDSASTGLVGTGSSPEAFTDAEVRRAWLELAAVYGVLMLVVWEPWRFLGGGAVWLVLRAAVVVFGLVIVARSVRRRRPGLTGLGLARASWPAGRRSLTLFTVGVVLGIVLLAALLGSLSTPRLRASWTFDYAVSVILQQLVLHAFVAEQLWRITRGNLARTAGSGAVLMAIAHLPNPWLSLMVMPPCAFWIAHFRRWRNLTGMFVSHFVIGVTAMAFLGELLVNLRTGYGAGNRFGWW